jgi:glutamate 5-kinase
MARKMATLGIRTHIAAAREKDVVARILKDEDIGTTIAPLPGKRNAVKRWLASEINLAPASVTANKCLADLVRDPNQTISLLPVGLVAVKGEFDKGDLVQVIDEKGKVLALGVARYDGAALRKVLEKKQQPVFIHYDQLHRITDE